MSATAPINDRRALLASIGHRLVRVVAAEISPYSAALFGVIHERQARWEGSEWSAVCDELDASNLTVSEFLQAEHLKKGAPR